MLRSVLSFITNIVAVFTAVLPSGDVAEENIDVAEDNKVTVVACIAAVIVAADIDDQRRYYHRPCCCYLYTYCRCQSDDD